MTSQPKVKYMGEEVSFDDLPEAEATSFEDYFAPVKLTPPAIDRASQIVPEKHWTPEDVFLAQSASGNEAFKRMPMTQGRCSWGNFATRSSTQGRDRVKMVTLVN